jgi:acyl carrier protein
MPDTEQQLRAFFRDNFLLPGDRALGLDDSLMDLGIMDSTGVLELSAFLEQAFGVHVADKEMTRANLDSIRAIVRFLAHKQAPR